MANQTKKYKVYLNPYPYVYCVIANTENDLPNDSRYEDSEILGWNPGSSCICLAEQTLWMLNVDKQWQKITVDLDEVITPSDISSENEENGSEAE